MLAKQLTGLEPAMFNGLHPVEESAPVQCVSLPAVLAVLLLLPLPLVTSVRCEACVHGGAPRALCVSSLV